MSRYKSYNEFKNSYATIHLNYDDTIDIIFGGDDRGSLKLSVLEALNFGRSLISTVLYEMNERQKILELEKDQKNNDS